MTVDLHLVSWNRPKMTELTIKTIHRNTKRENFRLTVLDNGSDKETTTMLSKMFNDKLIDNYISLDTNHGLEAARQYLLTKYTNDEYFICVDNDCLPEPITNTGDWIDKLVDLMDRYEDYGAISCRTQVMIGTGNIFEDTKHKDITDFPWPGGSLRIMRTKETLRLGGWDKKTPGRGSEERYICGKLQDNGFKTGFATNIYTLHLFGTRGDNETDRWGYDKNMTPERTGHSDISHPALTNGDNPYDVEQFAGKELTIEYFQFKPEEVTNVNSNN